MSAKAGAAKGAVAGAAKGAAAGNKQGKKRAASDTAAVIDDLFAAIPKRAAREAPAEPEEAPASKPKARGAAAPGKPAAGGERRPEPRRKQQEYFLDNGEKIVPVRCGRSSFETCAKRGLTARSALRQRAAPHSGRLAGVQVLRRL